MKAKLKEYLETKDRRTWFYYHLKRDATFKTEAAKLREQIAIDTPYGKYYPTESSDFDLYQDPEAASKTMLVAGFMERWNVHWDYSLLAFLLDEDENVLPPMFKCGFAVGLNKERNMIEAQIPTSVQHEELEYLWLMILGLKEDAGIDITKKPRKNTFTEPGTQIAYEMWKLRKADRSWTEVVKDINARFNRSFDIKAAQRHLSSNGYVI